jgi:hypothetical protein
MSKINAFSRVLNQKVKTRFLLMDCQLMDKQNNGIAMFNTSNEGTGGLGISYSSRKMRGKVLNFI